MVYDWLVFLKTVTQRDYGSYLG